MPLFEKFRRFKYIVAIIYHFKYIGENKVNNFILSLEDLIYFIHWLYTTYKSTNIIFTSTVIPNITVQCRAVMTSA